jgi:ABC-2 type transport system permease protein
MTSTLPISPNDERQAIIPVYGVSSRGWPWSALGTLYRFTLRQHLHGRRFLIMVVLFLVPAALAILVRATAPDVPPAALEFMLLMMFVPQALLPLVALLYASGIIQDEQEEQTITYLLIRPIPKWAIYTVKLLATVTTTVFLTTIFTVLTCAVIFIGTDVEGQDVAIRCLKTVAIHALAVTAYCSLFGLMSILTKRILVVGILYTVVVEGLLANLPFSIRLATVIYYTRLIAYRTLDFVIPVPGGRTENIAAEAWQFDVRRDPNLLEHPQLSTCVLVLLVASLVCTILAAWLCAQREFHVKTPEKE